MNYINLFYASPLGTTRQRPRHLGEAEKVHKNESEKWAK